MAKKSKTRQRRQSGQTSGSTAKRQRLLLGGVGLLVVVGVVVGIRMSRQSSLPPQLLGASEGHYTRGNPKATVIGKEFSDYT